MMNTILKKTLGAVAFSVLVLGASAASAVETGQILDRGRFPRTLGKAECPGPACTPEVINAAERSGEITPKEAKALRTIQSNPQAATENSLCGLSYTPPCRSDAAQTGRRGVNSLAIAGGLAAAIGIAVAVGSGNSQPASR
jgi:hypothetical protein